MTDLMLDLSGQNLQNFNLKDYISGERIRQLKILRLSLLDNPLEEFRLIIEKERYQKLEHLELEVEY